MANSNFTGNFRTPYIYQSIFGVLFDYPLLKQKKQENIKR